MRLSNLIPKGRVVLLVLALASSLVFVAVVQTPAEPMGPPELLGSEGPWMNPVNSTDCQDGTICAEWPSRTEGLVYVCCIDPALVGTIFEPGRNCSTILEIRAW